MKAQGIQFIVVAFLVLLPASLMAQWTPINTPEYNPTNTNCTWQYHRSVGAHDKIYWAYMANCPAGSMGQFNEYEIFASGNSGAWNSLLYMNSIDLGLGHLEFISADTGCFVSGSFNSQQVYRTANALQVYEVCPAEGDFAEADLEMLSYDEIFVLDYEARFWRLEEDTLRMVSELGLDFSPFDKPILCSPTTEHLFIACKVEENGTYTNDLILRSMNGGNSWDTSYLSETVSLNDIQFASASLGFAVADNGILLKTENGGESWEVKNSGVDDKLYSVDFRDPMTWLIGAESTMLITWDGGETWDPKYGPNGSGAGNVHFPEKDNIVYVGSTGLWKTDIDFLTGINSYHSFDNSIKLFPNPADCLVRIEVQTHVITLFNIELINSIGTVLYYRENLSMSHTISLNSLPDGLYFIRVMGNDVCCTERLLIQK